MKFAALQSGETVAVLGAGPIGLLTVACLKLAGAGRIWRSSRQRTAARYPLDRIAEAFSIPSNTATACARWWWPDDSSVTEQFPAIADQVQTVPYLARSSRSRRAGSG